MKKILCVTMLLSVFCFAFSCDLFEKDNGVTCKEYENCAVFTFEDFSIGETAKFELARTVHGEGAIYYQINLEEGALNISYKDRGFIHNEQPLGEFYADDEMPINGSGGYIEGSKITIIFETHSSVSGEIIIAFTEDALKAVQGDLQLHEHTFTYNSAGKAGHYATATCGCPSEEGTTPHYDEDTDYFCDYCKCDMTEFADEWVFDETHHWYVSDDAVYCYGEHENFDADLLCDICGYMMVDPPAPTNHFIRNQSGAEWLYEITAEDIAEIKMIFGGGGPLPLVSLTYISSSTDKAVISSIFEEYYWLDSTPASEEDTQIPDGGYFDVQFILKGGAVKKLRFINGDFYCDGNGNYFELASLPRFRDGTNFVNYYGFEAWEKYCGVYLVDETFVCEIPMSELEFVEVFDDIELGATAPTRYIEINGVKVYFLSDYYFYIGDDRSVYYQLVGKNLNEITEEYKLGDEEFRVTMNDEDWLYEDINPSYKAGEEISLKIKTATDLGYLLFVNGERVMPELDNNYDYWEFIFTMPNEDVKIDFKTYDGFLPHINYSILIESFWEKIPAADSVSVVNYYGEFESGAIVAMMECSEYNYTEALESDTIGGCTFNYNNGNKILVLYQGSFYSLSIAYSNGYLTDADLSAICDIHKSFYPYLYL